MIASAVTLSPQWQSFGTHGTWQAGPINLRQRIGEVTLGRLSFQGAVFTHEFATTPTLSRELDELPFPEFPPGWDAIVIPSAPVEAPPAPLKVTPRAIRYVPHVYNRHFIELDRFTTFDDYLGRFNGKRRYWLRRQARSFKDHDAQPAFTVHRNEEELQVFHRLASELSAKTYQSRLIGAGLEGDEATMAVLCAGALEGRTRGYLLHEGGLPVAFALCERVGSWLIYGKTGYDPAFANRSPGTVLLYRIIESLIAEREIAYFDFAEGDAWYKERFATDSRLCADVYFVRPTVRSTFGVLVNRALAVSSRCAVRTLDALRLKQRVKTLLRRGEPVTGPFKPMDDGESGSP